MGREIERKFLVANDAWRAQAHAKARCVQGYLPGGRGCGVRVRRLGKDGYLTIKGPSREGVREEYEYPIPLDDANELLDRFCMKPLIEKTRYLVEAHDGITWEVDVFHGANAGLLLAEVELEDIRQPIQRPDWVGREVTGRPEYHNFQLVRHPFSASDSHYGQHA